MLDDDTARDLALAIGLQFEPADSDALAPLVDASLVWLEEEARAPIAASVVEALWPRELREDIERGLDAVARRSRQLKKAAARGRADLARGPERSRLARAVVDQAADERAFELQLPVGCPHCLDEGIARSDDEGRRERATMFAQIAGHAAAIPDEELREALDDGAAAVFELATDERRADVRWWLRRIALLGQHSIPHLSAALVELLDEPMPAVEHDEVWRAAVDGLERRLALQLH